MKSSFPPDLLWMRSFSERFANRFGRQKSAHSQAYQSSLSTPELFKVSDSKHSEAQNVFIGMNELYLREFPKETFL